MLSLAELRALAGRRSQAEPASGQPAAQTPAPAPNPSPTEKPAAPSGTAENRVAVRFPAAAVPSITGLRFSPLGAEAVLLNISTTGLLAQCAVRLQPGSSLTVLVDGTFEPRSIRGRVARTSVAALAGGRLLYHVGIAFTTPIPLGHLETQSSGPVPSVEQQAAAPATVASPAVTPKELPLRNRW